MNDTLTLTAIFGNVEQYMERFLRSFAPLVDEVVLVRAIGSQTPDNSWDIAKRVMAEFGKPLVIDEYLNAPQRQDWPHVDSFAAARNHAASLATTPWLMWADTDDVIGADSIPKIRDAISRADEDIRALQWEYRVPDDGLTVWRERAWRNGTAKWQNAIHEHLVIDGDKPKVGTLRGIEHTHSTTGSRKPNSERNLRILESLTPEEINVSMRFHLAQSLRECGRTEEARRHAEILIQDANAETPERFEMLMFLGQTGESLIEREAYFLQALALAPERREAYADLAMVALINGNPERMRAWARAMQALPAPREWAWNDRRKHYGYLGVRVDAMSRRLGGDIIGGDALEFNRFERAGRKISLIHATRGRAKKAIEAMRVWFEKAADPEAVEHLFCIDEDDGESMAFLTAFRHVINTSGGPVGAWNTGAEASAGRVLVQMSDDWDPPVHWDRMILERLDVSKPQVLAISDGHRTDSLLCMAIMTRERYKEQGWMFHPEFWSMYSDNWFTHCAYRDGVVVEARDLVFHHQHPFFVGGDLDTTYKLSNCEARYAQGQAIFERLANGKLTSHEVDGWCDFRNLYTAFAQVLPEDGTFVEVGAWKGQSIIHLAHRLQELGKKTRLVAVDTFGGDKDTGFEDVLAEFEANIESAGVDVQPIIRESVEAAATFEDGSLDGVFIDAAHDYDNVMADLAAWKPKVREGGLFGGHDVDAPGVVKALKDSGIKYQTIGRCWLADK